MQILVIGATGATGRFVVRELLSRGHNVTAIVRSSARLAELVGDSPQLTVVQGSVLDLTEAELATHLEDCDAVVSCLGHTLDFKGLFGQPRRLVTDSVRRLCTVIKAREPGPPARFALMNTTGVRNHDLEETVSVPQRIVLGLLRHLVPPHADNEDAADFLRTEVGQSDPRVEWVVIRPDTLINESEMSDYHVHPSPTRSAIFDSGKTSRINVACFMTKLVTDDQTWTTWKGRMPVIYNQSSGNA